jgi:hypothetical protein
MADSKGNGNSNGWWQLDRDGSGNGQRWPQWQWPMATVTAKGNCDGDGDGNSDGDGNGNGNGNGHGKGNHYKEGVASSCGGNVQCFFEGRHLSSTPMDTNKSACIMGVTLLVVFAPLQWGGFLTAHHGLFFVYFLLLLFSLLNNPLFAPPRIIQALKNPVSWLTLYLLHSSKHPFSLLTIYPGFYCTFCQGKPGQGLQWL